MYFLFSAPPPQTLREPVPGSFDTLAPTVACPPGDSDGAELGVGLGAGVEVAQLRQFTFSSELQRMSVIVSHSHSHVSLFSCSHVSIPGTNSSNL